MVDLRRVLRPVIVGLGILAGGMAAAAVPPEAAEMPKAHTASNGFGYDEVERIAAGMAAEAYVAPDKIPEFLQKLSYDQWRDIRFKTDRSLWRGENLLFEVQFFHPGFLYNAPVKINLVEGAAISEYPFSPELFNYGMNDFGPRIPRDLGFAGFRVHHPLNRKDYYDEVIVFLGATYFRALAGGQKYGASARALAIDAAEPGGEEFPFFKEFWLLKPEADRSAVTVWALLDSPSVSGAYEFVIEPGHQTLVHVRSTLFRRRAIKKIGLAPMTSMFLHGENVNVRSDDFRPEVHDSDGLLIGEQNGEWIWRPLRNPGTLHISTFPIERLNGFGLLQRDLDFEHYQDLGAFFQQKPSIWISPEGQWGPGRVELIEIPTNTEINDNIIAYWVPRDVPAPEHPISLKYLMSWYSPGKHCYEKGWVAATRTAAVGDQAQRRFLIEFRGGRLEALDDALALEPVVTVTQGARIVDLHLQHNSFSGSWRLVFSVVPDEKELLDKMMAKTNNTLRLRAFLRHEGDAVTETWSYRYDY